MATPRTTGPLPAPALPLDDEERSLLQQARALQSAAAAGCIQPLLRGKHLCLLCDDDTLPAALLFRQAAAELGAKVTHIGVSLGDRSDAREVEHTARVLGRLYDAVECQGLDRRTVERMARVAGVAVYDSMATQDPRAARLSMLLSGDGTLADARRFALQALLLHTVG